MVRGLLFCTVWVVGCVASVQPEGEGEGEGEGAASSSEPSEAQSTGSASSGDGPTGSTMTKTTTDTSTTAADEAADVCLVACADASDCGMGVEAYDEDNYACLDGGCVYSGCNSDAECSSLGEYVCRDVGPLRVCQPACAVVADCDMGLAPYDEDNYACVDGGCDYLGCVSDAECAVLGAYTCAVSSSDISYCAPSCDAVSDCVGTEAAYDEDNYVCEDGACVYLGCNSDAECEDSGDYVCGESLP